jgi:hypothetical protein
MVLKINRNYFPNYLSKLHVLAQASNSKFRRPYLQPLRLTKQTSPFSYYCCHKDERVRGLEPSNKMVLIPPFGNIVYLTSPRLPLPFTLCCFLTSLYPSSKGWTYGTATRWETQTQTQTQTTARSLLATGTGYNSRVKVYIISLNYFSY